MEFQLNIFKVFYNEILLINKIKIMNHFLRIFFILSLFLVSCSDDNEIDRAYQAKETISLKKNTTATIQSKSTQFQQIELLNDPIFQTGFNVLEPTTGVIQGSLQYTSANGSPQWNLTQWYSSSSIYGSSPTILSSGSYQFADSNKAITIGPSTSSDGNLIFALNGFNDFNGVYRGASDPFPHLLADQRIADPDGWLGTSTPFIGEMSSLDFSIDALLQYHVRNQLSGYNPAIHSLQYNCVFLIQNLRQGNSGYGKNMYFMSTLFDDRYPVPSQNIQIDLFTGKFIYDVGLIPFSSTGLTVGTWKTISGNLLPLIKNALNEAWGRGILTESTLFSDYKVSMFTTGFECSGLNIGTMQIKNLILTAHQTVDYDGNVYNTVNIGNDIWMVENFKSTHFNDGSPITINYHPDDPTHIYGPSYSWNDIVKPSFVPAGWHVATDVEWQALYDYVAGDGNKLKEIGSVHWNTANGTNETGFTAFGSAHIYGAALKTEGTWWVATENDTTNGLRWSIFDNGNMWRGANDKNMFFPVRLVKNK